MVCVLVCVCICLYINEHVYGMSVHVQEVIAFQADSSSEVRKFVVTFMEEAW